MESAGNSSIFSKIFQMGSLLYQLPVELSRASNNEFIKNIFIEFYSESIQESNPLKWQHFHLGDSDIEKGSLQDAH